MALIAVARLALDTRASARVTYVPGGALEPAPAREPAPALEPGMAAEPEPAAAPEPEPAAAPEPHRSAPVGLLDDAALWQPTEVIPAVVAAPDAEPKPTRWRDPGLALPPVDWTVPTFRLDDAAPWQPPAIALTPPVAPQPEPKPEPELELAMAFAPAPEPAVVDAPAPEPEAAPASPPAFVLQTPDGWGWAEPWAFEVPAAGGATEAGMGAEASPRRRGISPVLPVLVILIAAAISVWTALPRSRPPQPRPKETETAEVTLSPQASSYALRTIPGSYLQDYWKAAEEYGLDWTELAAVGQIESDQGRSETPGVSAGTNTAGAAGPAQFLGGTWARFGVDADGRGPANPYDPADAITAMAAYLKASGAPENWRGALYTYNHSTAYVNAVLALSRRYSVQSGLDGP